MNQNLEYRSELLSADVADVIDKEDRTVSLGVCSENPVHNQIISCRSEDMDLSFFDSGGAPLLFEHDPSKQIGHVVSANLNESKGQLRAVVRFSRNSELANEIFNDVADGVRRNISVGFQPLQQVESRSDDPSGTSRLKTKIIEVSVVSIPADKDSRVGVGRSDESNPTTSKEDASMSDDIQTEPVDAAEPITEAFVEEVAVEAVRAEQTRAAEILNLATRHDCADIGQTAIQSGKSVDQFRAEVLDRVANRPVSAPEIVRPRAEQEEYSIWRGIQSAMRHGGVPEGFEGELSQEMQTRTGKRPSGFYVPPGALLEKRNTITTTETNAAADNLIATDHHDEMFIEALRDKSVVIGLGARVFTGLTGDIDIPKQTDITGIKWVGENAAPTADNPAFGKISMTPHTATQTVALSRRIQQQSEPMINRLIMEDLRNGMATAIDSAVLQGSDTNGPTGLFPTMTTAAGASPAVDRFIYAATKTGAGANVDGKTGTTGVKQPVSYEMITKLVSMLETENVPMDNLAFVCNPKMLHQLRNITLQAAGVEGNFIMSPGSRDLVGYRVATSNFVADQTVNDANSQSNNGAMLFFGNWSEVIVGYWSGLDIRVNPYAEGKKDELQIHAFQDMDCQFRHIESFAAARGLDG